MMSSRQEMSSLGQRLTWVKAFYVNLKWLPNKIDSALKVNQSVLIYQRLTIKVER